MHSPMSGILPVLCSSQISCCFNLFPVSMPIYSSPGSRDRGDEGCTKMWSGSVLSTRILWTLSAWDTTNGDKRNHSVDRNLQQPRKYCSERICCFVFAVSFSFMLPSFIFTLLLLFCSGFHKTPQIWSFTERQTQPYLAKYWKRRPGFENWISDVNPFPQSCHCPIFIPTKQTELKPHLGPCPPLTALNGEGSVWLGSSKWDTLLPSTAVAPRVVKPSLVGSGR